MPSTTTVTERPEDDARATRLFWTICLLGWTALLVITASSIYVAGIRPFQLVIQMTLAMWLPYVVLTPLVFLLVRRFPFTLPRWRSCLGIHLLASVMFVLVCECAFLGVLSVLAPALQRSFQAQLATEPPAANPAPTGGRMLPMVAISPESGLPIPNLRMSGVKAVANLPLYWVLAAFAHALLATARLREREQQAAELVAHLTQAQLAGLRTQLHPHFLFNTLNSISALIPRDARLANEMVLNLSDLLRMTLRYPERGLIPLREELKLIGHYVDIQRLRFGERLRFTLEVADETLDTPAPPLLLQPLVENAIRYGVEPSDQPETVTVRGRFTGECLFLEVVNTCHAPAEGKAEASGSTGVGLANTRGRLAALYGAAHTFRAAPLSDGGFRVEMEIPRHEPVPRSSSQPA